MKIRKLDGSVGRLDESTPIDQSLTDKVREDTRSSVEQVYEQAHRLGQERRQALERIDDQALKRSAQE